MKGPTGKSFEGIYSNARFIHSAASLVGSVVSVQVKNGSIYEGVFRTFSHKVDFVLEMVHKIDNRQNSNVGTAISDINPKEVTDKMIFRIADVVMLSAVNVDLDYAIRDTFTDTAISKFNGQVQERELEPWDDGFTTHENIPELGEAGGDVSNGWDADEMFRTNEEKYGVKSSFDSNLHDYTIPLRKQNTEGYKNQEAKASKIAQEIESSSHYKNRIALENGDEEDRFSAVARPPENAANNNINNIRFNAHRGRKIQVVRPPRSSPSPTTHSSNRISHPQSYHKMGTPNTLTNNSQNKMTTVKPMQTNVQSPSPKPVSSPSLTPRQPSTSPSQAPLSQHQLPAVPQYQAATNRNTMQSSSSLSGATLSQSSESRKLNNGETPRSTKESLNKESSLDTPHKNIERIKEIPEKKPVVKKPPHDDKTEDLKRFHEKFKLPENKDLKESRKEHLLKKSDSKSSDSSLETKQQPLEQKHKEEKSDDSSPDTSIPDTSKSSKLNPNAKEFVLNPNAKSFTPRAIPMQTSVLPPPPPPPPVQPPPRLHNQSPVIAVPQPMITGMPHPVFSNMPPHYVLPGTPVTVSTQYTPATSIAQAPRFRKGHSLQSSEQRTTYIKLNALPVTLPRSDSSQSIHVQAATGQPILAPPTLSAPQFTIQYASPGILHPSAPPQAQIATYAQMYQMVGPRVIGPQPLGMVSAPGSYGESPHVPTPIFMNPQAVTGVQHPGGPSGNSGQHSASSTPQSQTPSLHPAPSPVHQQPPPPAPPHGQPPTPTGHPGTPTPQLVYHGQLAPHHPLHPGAAGHAHPYQTMYGTGPQPIIMLPQQPGPHPPHPPTFQALQNHYHHAQNPGPHGATPNQILPHPPVPLMPTSTAMGHGQVPVSNSPYVPHSQEVLKTVFTSDDKQKKSHYMISSQTFY